MVIYANTLPPDVQVGDIIQVAKDTGDLEKGKSYYVVDIDAKEVVALGGVSDHDDLLGKDKANQHPISSITGLVETLEGLDTKIDEEIEARGEAITSSLGSAATANVVQTTGDSTSDVMSQKAVTEAIQACCNGNGGDNGNSGSGESLKSLTWDMANDIYSGDWGVTSVHLAMRRCVVNEQAEVVYYLDPYDSTKKEDGTPAKLDGTDGDVMVEIPQVWYKTEFNGAIRTDSISDRPREGFTLHPRFRNGAVSKIYIGAYDASMWKASTGAYINGPYSSNNTTVVDFTNDRLASVTGKIPMGGLTRAQFRTLAANAGGTLEQFYEWQLLQLLFAIEYGNWNSQAVLAMGNVEGNSLNPSGLSNTLGNQSGGIGQSGATAFMSYRGIENLWGNIGTFIDGITYNNRVSYVNDGSSPFADDTTTGYTQLGNALPFSGYIKSWQNLEGVFVPASNEGTSSTYIGDQLWTNTGWSVVIVGGYAVNGLRAGLATCMGNNNSVAANQLIGSRLSREKLT